MDCDVEYYVIYGCPVLIKGSRIPELFLGNTKWTVKSGSQEWKRFMMLQKRGADRLNSNPGVETVNGSHGDSMRSRTSMKPQTFFRVREYIFPPPKEKCLKEARLPPADTHYHVKH